MGVKRKIKSSGKQFEHYLVDDFEEFIVEKETINVAPDTIRNYNLSFTLFMSDLGFNDETLTNDIDRSTIFHWIGIMRNNDKKVSTMNHYLRDIRSFLYWCMDEDRRYLEEPFKIKLIEGQEEQLKIFTDEEMQALLLKPYKNASFSEWRTYTIVNWVLGTGNRAATICSIKLENVSFRKKEIILPHTKNKKAQTIPLSSALETCLKEYIKMWRNDAAQSDYLFCNIAEEKLTTNALRQSFEKYCKSRGVNKTNIHGLRHNFAKGWVQNNGNMYKLQEVMGHSSLDMTRKYVKLFGEDLKEDYDKFSPLDTMKKKAKRTRKVTRNEW